MEHTEHRRTYTVASEGLTRPAATAVCAALLDVVAPLARRVYVDPVSDWRDLPADVAAAERVIQDQDRTARRIGMIEVDPTDPALMDALRVYAAWSICVEIHGDGPGLLASMDDSGRSICAELTVTEAQDWRSSVNGCVAIEPLEDTHRRRRQSRWRLWRRRQ